MKTDHKFLHRCQGIFRWRIGFLLAAFFQFMAHGESTNAWLYLRAGSSYAMMGGGHEIFDAEGNEYKWKFFTNSIQLGSGSYAVQLPLRDGFNIYFAKFDALTNLLWVHLIQVTNNAQSNQMVLDQERADSFVKSAQTNLPLPLKKWAWLIAHHQQHYAQVAQMVLDPEGACYILGSFVGTLLLEGAGQALVCQGEQDIFLAKFSPTGRLLRQWQWGGPGRDSGIGLGIDRAGMLYMAGAFAEQFDLPTSTGNHFKLTAPKQQNGFFFAKLNPEGECIWVRQFPAPSGAEYMAVSPSGDIYLTAEFRGSVYFDEHYQLSSKGADFLKHTGTDLFLAKYDPNGNLIWVRTAVGLDALYPVGIKMDEKLGIFIMGRYSGQMCFGPTNNPTFLEVQQAGENNIFYARYDGDGNFGGALRIGGEQREGYAVVFDGKDRAYLVPLKANQTQSLAGTTNNPTGTNQVLVQSAFATANAINKGPEFQGIRRLDSGDIQIVVAEAGVGQVVIEASLDLARWYPVLTNQTVGPMVIKDSEASVYSMRFYRAVWRDRQNAQ